MRRVWAFAGLLLAVAGACAAAEPSYVSTFQCDVTPPKGEALIWNVPLEKVLDPLLAKGIIIDQGSDRFVLCTLDWCELCNDSDLVLRRKLADALGTDISRVRIQAVHQHAAPYADRQAHKYLDAANPPVLRLSDAFLTRVADEVSAAAREAIKHRAEFDKIGAGQAKVDRVASARRLRDKNGKSISRFSTSGASTTMAAAPEGEIDPWLKTITLAKGDRPLVRMHFYATHPQTFACDGRASRDTVGIAREQLQQKEGVFQIYFTGCAGDVTVGKYNDGKDPARAQLSARVLAGMEASIATTKWEPASRIAYRVVDLKLSPREDMDRAKLLAQIQDPKAAPGLRVYDGAMRLAFLDRIERPLNVSALELGRASVVMLPGEPMLEFQRFAQHQRPDRFVCVGGYFDCGPAYICTDEAVREGGYEPSATNVGVGSEAKLKDAIRAVLASGSGGAE